MITSQQKKINITIKWLVDTREMQIFYTIINNACTCSCLLQKMFDKQLKHINVSTIMPFSAWPKTNSLPDIF